MHTVPASLDNSHSFLTSLKGIAAFWGWSSFTTYCSSSCFSSEGHFSLSNASFTELWSLLVNRTSVAMLPYRQNRRTWERESNLTHTCQRTAHYQAFSSLPQARSFDSLFAAEILLESSLRPGCEAMNNAVQLWDNQLSIITTPIPHVSSQNEVLVKVAFSGVCGTDLHILAGDFPSAKCVVLGHEFAGVVSEVGSEVKNVSVGDR